MKYLHTNPSVLLPFLKILLYFFCLRKFFRLESNIPFIMHTINCNQKTGGNPMSDLAATNCQNSCSSGCGCGCGNDGGFNNCFWLLLILLCCNNGNDCGCGCGNDGGFNNCFWLLLILLCCNNGNDCGCGCGNDNLIWLILILCCCGNGCGIGTSGNGCGCGCGC